MIFSKKIVPLVVLFSLQAQAATMVFHANGLSRQLNAVNESMVDESAGLVTDLSFNIRALDYNQTRMEGKAFTTLKADSLETGAKIGEPALPFQAVIVPGTPADIEVSLDIGSEEVLSGVRPAPAQKEVSRANPDKVAPLAFSARAYSKTTPLYRVEALGDFRGVQYSRVIVSAAAYDGVNGDLTIYPSLKASILSRGESKKSAIFANMRNAQRGLYDYLIITPKAFEASLAPFVQWKRKFGHTLKVVTLESLAATAGAATTAVDLEKFIKAEYNTHKYMYALLVGSEKLLPLNYLPTSGSSKTPTDSKYFIMGDAADFIPDVYHARLIAESEVEVKNQIAKWMAYESASMPNIAGFQKMIGIASNEGSNPSDKQYIEQIQTRLKEKAGTEASHFYQSAANSNPAGVNAAFNLGALWTVYIGHGSGTSWPSLTKQYSTANILEMNNADQVKPVIIDIACQNGKLVKGNFGERMMNSVKSDKSIGATAYYGGSVDISWHPPAILARGVIYNYFDKKLVTLGESLFSGHLYLAQNHSDKNELINNYRWFHLFGDPSMRLRDRTPVSSNAVLAVKAQEHEHNLYVLTKDGAPLAEATITLFDAKEDKSVVIVTDKKGEFVLENQRDGMETYSHFYHWAKNEGLKKYALK